MPRIERQTCEYVLASDLFEGLVSLRTVLMQCNCGFTWGGNNRSLVTAESILNVLDQTDCSPLLMGKLRKRVDEIGLQTYIDLEN